MSDFLVTDRLAGTYRHCAQPAIRSRQSIGYISSEVSSELILIRTLIGTVTVENCLTGLTWNQTRNYSTLGCPTSSSVQRDDLIDFLQTSHSIDPSTLDIFLRKNIRHESFYQELVGELLHSVWRSELGDHTLAFVHIYRFLERISFAFPMLYSARSTDFKAAYTAVQQYFAGGGEKSELAFFKKFLEISIDEQLRQSKVKIDIASLPSKNQGRVYAVLSRFLKDESTAQEPDSYIEIQYKSVLGLIINLRNRFFHFNSNHEGNITAIELGNSDNLYEVVNMIFLNWLAVIHFEILGHQLT